MKLVDNCKQYVSSITGSSEFRFRKTHMFRRYPGLHSFFTLECIRLLTFIRLFSPIGFRFRRNRFTLTIHQLTIHEHDFWPDEQFLVICFAENLIYQTRRIVRFQHANRWNRWWHELFEILDGREKHIVYVMNFLCSERLLPMNQVHWAYTAFRVDDDAIYRTFAKPH